MTRWLLCLLLVVGCSPQTTPPPIGTTNAVVLVGLGDSITAGFGARPGYSYFDLLEKDLRAVAPQLRVSNRSVSGSTSLDLLRHQLPQLPTQPSNVTGWVVITTGGNDIIHNYGRTPPKEGAMFGATLVQTEPWIASFERRLGRILDEVQARFPGGCRIFLANIYDPTDGTGKASTSAVTLPDWPDGLKVLAAYNAVIARVALDRPGVQLVDIHTAFRGHGVAQFGNRCWYHVNIEDPNERGYDALRRVFLQAMSQEKPL
jgi:lysophospholipase L1-like esterase